MNEQRYFIDRRCGFTCIRDKTLIEDKESQCLEHEDVSIVKIWEGKYIARHSCPVCGRQCSSTWEMPYEIEIEAENLCKELNVAEKEEDDHKVSM